MGSDAMPSMIGSETLKAVFMGAFGRLDRLPALQTALERAGVLGIDFMREASEPSPELLLGPLEPGTAADALAEHEGASAVAVLDIAQWNARALMSADRACVFAIVEMMLGGDGVQTPRVADRAFSKIELAVVQKFFERIAAALETAFAPVAKSTFVVSPVSDRIDFDVIGRRHSPVVVARYRLQVWQQSGEILLVIPKAAIDSMRQVLSRAVSDDEKIDPRWSNQIKDKITRTSVTLSGVLDERLAPLHEIADLKVGQILQLNATAASRVRVECGGEPLLWCQLGKSNGVYTLRVEEPIDHDQEFLSDILAG